MPVGEDQRQHVELTRDLAQRFNARFGETFVVPEPYIVKAAAKIFDLQDPTAKMSKSSESQAGVVDLLDDPASIAKKIKRAVTDTETETALRPRGEAGCLQPADDRCRCSPDATSRRSRRSYDGQGYGALKTGDRRGGSRLHDAVSRATQEWLADEARLDAVLADGAARARKVAGETLERAYDAVGFLPAKG